MGRKERWEIPLSLEMNLALSRESSLQAVTFHTPSKFSVAPGMALTRVRNFLENNTASLGILDVAATQVQF